MSKDSGTSPDPRDDAFDRALALQARRRSRENGALARPGRRALPGPRLPVAATAVAPATHQVVLRLAERFGTPTPQQVFAAGKELLPARGLAAPHRQALRAQVITRAAVYFRDFALPGWSVTQPQPPTHLYAGYDVAWERDDRLWIDHLVMRRLGPRALAAARVRTATRLREASEVDGRGPEAIRVVVLIDPQRSFVVR